MCQGRALCVKAEHYASRQSTMCIERATNWAEWANFSYITILSATKPASLWILPPADSVLNWRVKKQHKRCSNLYSGGLPNSETYAGTDHKKKNCSWNALENLSRYLHERFGRICGVFLRRGQRLTWGFQFPHSNRAVFLVLNKLGRKRRGRGRGEEDNGTWAHIPDFLHTIVCTGPAIIIESCFKEKSFSSMYIRCCGERYKCPLHAKLSTNQLPFSKDCTTKGRRFFRQG